MAVVASLATMQRAQERALQSEGFVVKNCFIDEPPAEPAVGSRVRRRSAPPSPAARHLPAGCREPPVDRFAGCEKSDGAWTESDDDASTQASGSSPCRPCRRLHCADSVWTEDGGDSGRDCADAVDDGSTWSASEELRKFVLTKCAFLRIQGSSYRPFPQDNKSGCTGSLMFYIAGLPWARRARWVVPLRLGVSKVLECCGYHTTMCVGVLYVSDPAETFKIRISFAPSLTSKFE